MGTKNRFCKLFWISVLLLLEYIVDMLSDRFLFFREIEAKIDVFAIPKQSRAQHVRLLVVEASQCQDAGAGAELAKREKGRYLRRLKRTALSLTK